MFSYVLSLLTKLLVYNMNIKKIARNCLPFGLVEYLRKRKDVRMSEIFPIDQKNVDYSYLKSVQYLVSLGVQSHEVFSGSIPEDSLKIIKDVIESDNKERSHVVYSVLHVGNFVGVSLAYIMDSLQKIGLNHHVVAIDPNISHRGVENPQNLVCRLVSHFGLAENLLLCCGYSVQKSFGDDGLDLTNQNNPLDRLHHEAAPTNVLKTLGQNYEDKFHIAIIDGNHDGTYLERELETIQRLLVKDGTLILDDVSSDWPEVSDVAAGLEKNGWKNIIADGRIAIFRRKV